MYLHIQRLRIPILWLCLQGQDVICPWERLKPQSSLQAFSMAHWPVCTTIPLHFVMAILCGTSALQKPRHKVADWPFIENTVRSTKLVLFISTMGAQTVGKGVENKLPAPIGQNYASPSSPCNRARSRRRFSCASGTMSRTGGGMGGGTGAPPELELEKPTTTPATSAGNSTAAGFVASVEEPRGMQYNTTMC